MRTLATTTTIMGNSGPITLANNGTLIVDASGRVTTGDATAVYDAGTITTLTNAGHISASVITVYGDAIGTLTNSGTIGSALEAAIVVASNVGDFDNSGAIYGNGSGDAIFIDGNLGTLTNSGNIEGGSGTTLDVIGQAEITNEGTINSGVNGYAIYLRSGNSTVENAGSVDASNSGTAIFFSGSADRLILDPTSSISGVVYDNGGDGTLVIGGSTANTQTFTHSQYNGFSTIEFDNSRAKLVVSAYDLAEKMITSFAKGDSIEVTGFVGTLSSIAGSVLTLSDGAIAPSFVIASADPLSGFSVTNDGTNTYVSDPACYVRGTRILTDQGERAVEELAAGDFVVTDAGRLSPIHWLGHRTIDCSRHPAPSSAWPVCVSRHAFGEHVPARDLWLSPAHAIAAEGVLIPVGALINGVTIVQQQVEHVEYWHVELDTHDIIIAEGLPAESYLDCGNRTDFENGGGFLKLHPDFRPLDTGHFCRPLCAEGPEVERVRARLQNRLPALGMVPTSDAAPCVIADGVRIASIQLAPRRLAFLLPARCQTIALESRSFVPALQAPPSADRRSLGICTSRLQLDGTDIDLGDTKVFGAGWHAAEGNRRWTTGRAQLPPGTRLIVLDLIGTGQYWRNAEASLLQSNP